MRIFQMQRFSAIALLFFMTIHMIVVHYPPFHIDFEQIILRMANPVWKAIDIAFLFSVLIHALSGMYMVITDVEKFGKQRQIIAWGAAIFGVLMFLYGTKTILAFQPL